MIGLAKQIHGLYILQPLTLNLSSVQVATIHENNCHPIDKGLLWHYPLGHLFLSRFKC